MISTKPYNGCGLKALELKIAIKAADVSNELK